VDYESVQPKWVAADIYRGDDAAGMKSQYSSVFGLG